MVLFSVTVEPVGDYIFTFTIDGVIFYFDGNITVNYVIESKCDNLRLPNAHPVYFELGLYNRDKKVLGFINCIHKSGIIYYFETIDFLATHLIKYEDQNGIALIPNKVTTIIVSSDVKNLQAIVEMPSKAKQCAYADMDSEGNEQTGMNFIIPNGTEYVLHCTHMHMAFNCVGEHVGYFNSICDTYGIYITDEQYKSHQVFQKKMQNKY